MKLLMLCMEYKGGVKKAEKVVSQYEYAGNVGGRLSTLEIKL